MNLIIDQPGSLGDILFIQKIIHVLSNDYQVYHPVNHTFWNAGIDQVINPAICGPNIQLPSEASVYKCSDYIKNNPYDVMTSKYQGIGMDWGDWSDYLKYDRNYEREDTLRKILGIEKGEPFIFVNPYYSVYKPMNGVLNQIPEDYDGKVIYMKPDIPGGKIFDWCWVFENAEELHSVDTSIHYVIETLDIKAKKLTIHPRHYKYAKFIYDRILKHPWEWIDYSRDEWKKVTPMEAE